MGSPNFGPIGSAWVEIGADLRKLSTDLNAAIKQAEAAGNQIGTALDKGAQAGAAASGLKSVGAELGVLIDKAQLLTPALDKISSSAIGAGSALTAGITLPLTALAYAAVQSFASIDGLKRGLAAVTGSAEEAERQFVDLREVAKLPGLGLEEAARGAANLEAFGFSAAQTKDILIGFGNALASVGKGRAELDRVILQLGQMAGAGRVLIQDLRPIIQQVPQVATIIKDNFGPEALGAPQETLDKLGVSVEEFIATLVGALNDLPKTTGGILNALENFADSMKIAFADLGEVIAPSVEVGLNAIATAVETAVAVFKALPGPIQGVTIGLAAIAAAAGPALLAIGGITRGASETIKLMGSLRAAFTAVQAGQLALQFGQAGAAASGLTASLGALRVAAMALPWVALGVGVASLVAYFWEAEDAGNKLTTNFGNLEAAQLSAKNRLAELNDTQRTGLIDTKALTAATKDLEDATKALRDAHAETRREFEQGLLRDLSNAPKTKEEALRNSFSGTHGPGAVSDPMGTLRDAISQFESSSEDYRSATEVVEESSDKAATAISGVAEASEKAKDAVKEFIPPLKSIAEQMNSLGVRTVGEIQSEIAQTERLLGVLIEEGMAAGSLQPIYERLARLKEEAAAAGRSYAQVVNDMAGTVPSVTVPLREFADVMASMIPAAGQAIPAIQGLEAPMLSVAERLTAIRESYSDLGIVSAESFDLQADKFQNLRAEAEAAHAPLFEILQLQRGELENLIRSMEIRKESHGLTESENALLASRRDQLAGVNEQLDAMTGKQKETIDWSKEMEKTFRQTFDRLGQGITQAIVGAQTMGQVFTGVFRSIRDALIEMVVKALLIDLGNALTGTIGKVSELGRLFNSLGSSISGSVGGSGSAAGATGGAGAAPGGMGLLGGLGLLTGAIDALISGFQRARQENTLNAIEENTRRATLFLGDRGDGGILGVLFRILDELSFGTTNKAVLQIRDVLVSGESPGQSGGGTGYVRTGDTVTEVPLDTLADENASAIDVVRVSVEEMGKAATQTTEAAESYNDQLLRMNNSYQSVGGSVEQVTQSITASVSELDDYGKAKAKLTELERAGQQGTEEYSKAVEDLNTQTRLLNESQRSTTYSLQNQSAALNQVASSSKAASDGVAASGRSVTSFRDVVVNFAGTLGAAGNLVAETVSRIGTAAKPMGMLTPIPIPSLSAEAPSATPSIRPTSSRTASPYDYNAGKSITVNVQGGFFMSAQAAEAIAEQTIEAIRTKTGL